ncbi:hypothetical protein OsJ_11949 [Oryza sativa Japonica Group]|uniref:Uncharacterized protein n=1 Tax=Oryza sativa subsp. japonica TaxID=39947 RepID=A3AKZ8_ORYSJ|nr:hypothetical protein OsJ_11949 [Oryza sativa Japonica Group]
MAAQRRRRRRAPEESRVLRIGGGGESEEQRAEDDEEGSGSRIATVSFPFACCLQLYLREKLSRKYPCTFGKSSSTTPPLYEIRLRRTNYAFSGGKQLTVPEPSSGRQRQLHVEVQ